MTTKDKFKAISKICRIIVEEKNDKYALSFISHCEGANGDINLKYKNGTLKKTNLLESIVEADTFDQAINETWDLFVNLKEISFGCIDIEDFPTFEIFSWNGNEFIEIPLC